MKYVVLVKVAHSLYHILQPLHSLFKAYIHSHAILAIVRGYTRLEVHGFEAAIARTPAQGTHRHRLRVHLQQRSTFQLAVELTLVLN
jgi:hypothetical protein